MLSRKKIQEGLQVSGIKQVFVYAYDVNLLGQNLTELKLQFECLKSYYNLL
jgi:hypothetical protein